MEWLKPIRLSKGTHRWFKDVLGFSDSDFDQFVGYTLETHKEMLCCPVWSNMDALFSAIPPQRVSMALASLEPRCNHLFPDILRTDVLHSALRSRLYICRESWRDGKKRARDRRTAEVGSDQSQDPGTSQLTANTLFQPAFHRSLRITLRVPGLLKLVQQRTESQHISGANVRLHSHQQQTTEPTVPAPAPGALDTNLSPPSPDNLASDMCIISLMKSTPRASSTSCPEDNGGCLEDEPAQPISHTDSVDDADTITVDVEGQQGLRFKAVSTKTSSLKRRRAGDTCHKLKRRRLRREQDGDLMLQLGQSTRPSKSIHTFSQGEYPPSQDASYSVAESTKTETDLETPVAAPVSQPYASWAPKHNEVEPDKHETQHNPATRPYSTKPSPTRISAHPKLSLCVPLKHSLPSPSFSEPCRNLDSDLCADIRPADKKSDNKYVSIEAIERTTPTAERENGRSQGDGRDAEEKVLQLEAKVQQLEKSLREVQSSVELRVQGLSAELQLALKTNEALRQEKSVVYHSLLCQQAETETAQRQVVTLRSELEKEQGALKSSHEQTTALQQELGYLWHEHQNIHKSAAKARAELSEQGNQLQQSLESVKKHQSLIDDLHSKTHLLDRSLDDERQSHQNSIRELEVTNCALQKCLNDEKRSHQESIEELEGKIQQSLDKNRDSQEFICRLIAEKKVVWKSLEEKSTTLSNNEQETDSLRAENSNLQQLLSESQGKFDRYKQEAESAKRDLEGLHSQTKKELKKHEEETESAKNRLEGLLSETQIDFNKYKEEARSAKSNLEESLVQTQNELNKHKQDAESEITLWQSRINKLHCEMVNTRTSLEKEAEQSQNEATNMKQDAENAAKENENLHIQLGKVKNQATELEDAAQKYTNLYDSLILQHHRLSLEHGDLLEQHQLLQNTKPKLLLCKSSNHVENGKSTCTYKTALSDERREHEHYQKKANILVMRWQRFFGDLVYVFFKHIGEEYKRKRLRKIMREHGIDDQVVTEIFGVDRATQWEPFVVTALEDRDMTEATLETKLSQRLPVSSAEARKEIEKAVRQEEEL